MEKISAASVNDLIIEGIEGDYVFVTIKKQNSFYENSILEKWLPYIRDSKFILDIGANLGNHTLFWAKNMQYAAIYSFEPYNVNYERLSNNIANNSLKNVFPVNYGVGACKGYSNVLNFSEDNYGATTLDTNISDSGDISITDIDSFVSERGLSQVDFVKIDTEGFEESVLAGMQHVIELHHPDLWIEVSEESFRHVIDSLLTMNYVMADVEGFNVLFLAPIRHANIPNADIMNILAQHFNNLNRTNKYYQNYITTKGWVNAKNAIIEDLKQYNAKQKEELFHVRQKIQEQEKDLLYVRQKIQEQEKDLLYVEQKAKEQKEYLLSIKNEKNRLEHQLQEIQTQDYKFAQELANLILSQDSQVQVLLRAKHLIQTQQRELQLLRQENELYKQRWAKLSSKWYGKLALKIYYRLRVLNILK